MCELWEKLTGNYTTKAKVVDNVLILSLPDAVTPAIWRLELQDAKNTSFDIGQDEEGIFQLSHKPAKGNSKVIAAFDTREKAVKALMLTSRAMEKVPAVSTSPTSGITTATGETPAQMIVAAPQPARPKKWGTALIALLLLLLLVIVFAQMAPQPISSFSGDGNAEMKNMLGDNTTSTTGVPMSADAFLQGR